MPVKDDYLRKEELRKFSKYDCYRDVQKLDSFLVSSNEICARNDLEIQDSGLRGSKDSKRTRGCMTFSVIVYSTTWSFFTGPFSLQ